MLGAGNDRRQLSECFIKHAHTQCYRVNAVHTAYSLFSDIRCLERLAPLNSLTEASGSSSTDRSMAHKCVISVNSSERFIVTTGSWERPPPPSASRSSIKHGFFRQ